MTPPNIRIVLVETSHPGNIGAVARAMKTMGLDQLCLVSAKRFPAAEATARAAGADDVLYRARMCGSLREALSGCGWVVGTSARTRSIRWPELDPRACAAKALQAAGDTPVAVVFGREHAGLTNAELDRCHALVRIPTNPSFASLNLAGAVQVVGYEIQMARRSGAGSPSSRDGDSQYVTAEEIEGLYAHLETALTDIGYLDPDKPKLLMRRLRRLFNRLELERSELNILRGVLSAVQRAAKR